MHEPDVLDEIEATPRQLAFLTKLRVQYAPDISLGAASELIDGELQKRDKRRRKERFDFVLTVVALAITAWFMIHA